MKKVYKLLFGVDLAVPMGRGISILLALVPALIRTNT